MSVTDYMWAAAGLCLVLSLIGFLKVEGWALTVVWVLAALYFS